MAKVATIRSESAAVYKTSCESEKRIADEEAILAKADEILRKRYMRIGKVCCPADAKMWLRVHLGATPDEVFGVVFMDNAHQIITTEDLFRGTIDGASVHPRGVVAACMVSP